MDKVKIATLLLLGNSDNFLNQDNANDASKEDVEEWPSGNNEPPASTKGA